MKVKIGGERLGSGKGMQVEMHNFERSTHNQSRKWASTMGVGTLVPCFLEIGTNGDKFEIEINNSIRTIPTVAPLFGNFKFQCDIFAIPLRLYIGVLHNNMTNIGMKMNQVLFPTIKLRGNTNGKNYIDNKNWFSHPSSLIRYLGINTISTRKFEDNTEITEEDTNALTILSYWDIFKNYYANTQEKKAYVITNKKNEGISYKETSIAEYDENSTIEVKILRDNKEISNVQNGVSGLNQVAMMKDGIVGKGAFDLKEGDTIRVYIRSDKPIYLNKETWLKATKSTFFGDLTLAEIADDNILSAPITTNTNYTSNAPMREGDIVEPGIIKPDGEYQGRPLSDKEKIEIATSLKDSQKNVYEQMLEFVAKVNTTINFGKGYNPNSDLTIKVLDLREESTDIALSSFDLENIDNMRLDILKKAGLGLKYSIDNPAEEGKMPMSLLCQTYKEETGGGSNIYNDNQSINATPCYGLAIKTYQSDMFQNWMKNENIELVNDIAAVKVEVDGNTGTLKMDDLILAKKVYNMLNRIVMGKGTWQDWQEAVYSEQAITRAEQPIYVGGMSCEIGFEEVVSTAASNVNNQTFNLGDLAGKGTIYDKKGGKVVINCNEPMLIMGIASITPRIYYTEKGWWFNRLTNIDQLHKPSLDGIGFQSLNMEDMVQATRYLDGDVKKTDEIGKQVAWINYMSSVDEAFGEFANTMDYMILSRDYELDSSDSATKGHLKIKDATTYIDPIKYNYAFADAQRNAQNFWVQIAFKCESRRKMSAKQIPNL